jgi:acyl-CoA hydrolase
VSTLVTRRSFADDPGAKKTNSQQPESEICRCELVFVSVDEKGKPRPWNKS